MHGRSSNKLARSSRRLYRRWRQRKPQQLLTAQAMSQSTLFSAQLRMNLSLDTTILFPKRLSAGQASVELRAPIRRDESLRILDPAAFTWKKMTWEGFTEAVGRVTAQQFAAGRQSLNAALVGNKGATAAFSRATPWMTLSLLADLLKEHFPDVPDVKRALETWSAIKDGFEAERVLYDCLEHCNWADATQGTAFLDEWEQRGADHWQRSILAEFRAERTLRLGLVWNIFLARKGGAKARSASAAATRKSRSRNGARRSKRPGRKKAVN